MAKPTQFIRPNTQKGQQEEDLKSETILSEHLPKIAREDNAGIRKPVFQKNSQGRFEGVNTGVLCADSTAVSDRHESNRKADHL